jgi:hypothetical protein
MRAGLQCFRSHLTFVYEELCLSPNLCDRLTSFSQNKTTKAQAANEKVSEVRRRVS